MSLQGHKRTYRGQIAMSALPPKADIRPRDQDVCFGSKADIEARQSMSALPPKADIRERVLDVRYGPQADIPAYSITSSAGEERCW
jgi:hypothetical protein